MINDMVKKNKKMIPADKASIHQLFQYWQNRNPKNMVKRAIIGLPHHKANYPDGYTD